MILRFSNQVPEIGIGKQQHIAVWVEETFSQPKDQFCIVVYHSTCLPECKSFGCHPKTRKETALFLQLFADEATLYDECKWVWASKNKRAHWWSTA